MTDNNSPYHHFAHAYAGLLQQLAGVEQIAALEAYKTRVVGQDIQALANQQYQEITTPAGKEFFENHLKEAYGQKLVETGNQVTPAIWENAAQQVSALNDTLSQLDGAQKTEFLKSQGIDVTAENLVEVLNPKVAELLTNTVPALEAAQSLIPTPEVVGEQALQATAESPPEAAEQVQENVGEQTPKDSPPHKHDLQDSVINFVSTLLTAAKGEEATITRDEAQALIDSYPEQFSEHSNEHYTHVLMESHGNFSKHSQERQQEILIGAMDAFAKANNKPFALEALKEEVCCLQPNDIVAMMGSLRAIPTPGYEDRLHAARHTKSPVEEIAAQGESKCFTDRIKMQTEHATAASRA